MLLSDSLFDKYNEVIFLSDILFIFCQGGETEVWIRNEGSANSCLMNDSDQRQSSDM